MEKFSVKQLYLIVVNGKKEIAFLDDDNQFYNINKQSYKEKIEVVSTLNEYLTKNEIEFLFTDINGNPKQFLNVNEIQFLIKYLQKKDNIPLTLSQRQNIVSSNVVNIVSDLIGLNVNNNPSTPFVFNNSEMEILVSAKQLKRFKKNLFRYVKASLIADRGIILAYGINGRDYRISRSLNKAKIKETDKIKKNVFSINVNSEGIIKVNEMDVKTYIRGQENQKILRF